MNILKKIAITAALAFGCVVPSFFFGGIVTRAEAFGENVYTQYYDYDINGNYVETWVINKSNGSPYYGDLTITGGGVVNHPIQLASADSNTARTITFQGGTYYFSSSDHMSHTGMFYMTSSAVNVRFEGVTFDVRDFNKDLAAIFLTDCYQSFGKNITFVDCTFLMGSNTHHAYMERSLSEGNRYEVNPVNLRMEGCVFSGGQIGALASAHGTHTLNGCTFSGQSQYGFFSNGQNGTHNRENTVSINGCSFQGNGNGAAAIAIGANGTISISNSQVSGGFYNGIVMDGIACGPSTQEISLDNNWTQGCTYNPGYDDESGCGFRFIGCKDSNIALNNCRTNDAGSNTDMIGLYCQSDNSGAFTITESISDWSFFNGQKYGIRCKSSTHLIVSSHASRIETNGGWFGMQMNDTSHATISSGGMSFSGGTGGISLRSAYSWNGENDIVNFQGSTYCQSVHFQSGCSASGYVYDNGQNSFPLYLSEWGVDLDNKNPVRYPSGQGNVARYPVNSPSGVKCYDTRAAHNLCTGHDLVITAAAVNDCGSHFTSLSKRTISGVMYYKQSALNYTMPSTLSGYYTINSPTYTTPVTAYSNAAGTSQITSLSCQATSHGTVSKTVYLKATANQFNVTVSKGTYVGSVSGGGTYTVGSWVAITATAATDSTPWDYGYTTWAKPSNVSAIYKSKSATSSNVAPATQASWTNAYTVYFQMPASNVSFTATAGRRDVQAPSVSGSSNNTNWTNQPVKLTVSASDGSGSGLYPNTPYNWNDGNGWIGTNWKQVSANGTYTITVRDNAANDAYSSSPTGRVRVSGVANNSTNYTFTVNNIDPTPPRVDVTDGQIFYIDETASKTFTITDNLSGIDLTKSTVTMTNTVKGTSSSYSITNGNTAQTSCSVTVPFRGNTLSTDDCTISIRLYDRAGNTFVGTYYLRDNVAPTMTYTRDHYDYTRNLPIWTNDNVHIAISAADSGFGLTDNPYRIKRGNYSFGSWFANPATYAEFNGTHIIQVKDRETDTTVATKQTGAAVSANAPNISEYSIDIRNIDKVRPEVAGIDEFIATLVTERLEYGDDFLDRDNGTKHFQFTFTDDASGMDFIEVEVVNSDNGETAHYNVTRDEIGNDIYQTPTNNQHKTVNLSIDVTENIDVYYGDFVMTITFGDIAGNTTTETYDTTEFFLKAFLERYLDAKDHKNDGMDILTFQKGESGLLTVRAAGYADHVTITWPDIFDSEWTGTPKADLDYDEYYSYYDLEMIKVIEQDFMVPLYIDDGEYEIEISSYKDGHLLKTIRVPFKVEGTILDDFRTILR